MQDSQSKTRIVDSGLTEPTEAELERKQAEIMEKLRRVTPDQLANFRQKVLDVDRVGEAKAAWEKTIWEK